MHFTFPKLVLLLAATSVSGSLTFNVHEAQKPLSKTPKDFDAVKEALVKAEIISDVIDDFTPKCFVTPHYGKKNKTVSFGTKFKNHKTKERPSVDIFCPEMQSTTGLTLILTDPDAPSRDNPKWSEMCHWIAIATARNDDKPGFEILENAEEELVEYKPPGPPPKTGYHRYVFLLLEGPNSNLTLPEDRQHWGMGEAGRGVKDWAEREGLEVVGANYFLEKNIKSKKNGKSKKGKKGKSRGF